MPGEAQRNDLSGPKGWGEDENTDSLRARSRNHPDLVGEIQSDKTPNRPKRRKVPHLLPVKEEGSADSFIHGLKGHVPQADLNPNPNATPRKEEGKKHQNRENGNASPHQSMVTIFPE